MDKQNYFEIAKELVTMEMAVREFLPGTDIRSGRISCPLHHGHDKNMALYKDHFYCYVCNQGGDVIKFVAHIRNESAKQALIDINDAFGLGLPVRRSTTTKQRLLFDRENEERRKQQFQKTQTAIAKQIMYREVMKAYCYNERLSRELAPKSPDEEPSREWIIAIQKLNVLEELRWKYAGS